MTEAIETTKLIELSKKKTIVIEISITKLIKSIKFEKRSVYLSKKITIISYN
jgi:hypothetical protein